MQKSKKVQLERKDNYNWLLKDNGSFKTGLNYWSEEDKINLIIDSFKTYRKNRDTYIKLFDLKIVDIENLIEENKKLTLINNYYKNDNNKLNEVNNIFKNKHLKILKNDIKELDKERIRIEKRYIKPVNQLQKENIKLEKENKKNEYNFIKLLKNNDKNKTLEQHIQDSFNFNDKEKEIINNITNNQYKIDKINLDKKLLKHDIKLERIKEVITILKDEEEKNK